MNMNPAIIEVTSAFPRQLLQEPEKIIREAFGHLGVDGDFPKSTREVLNLATAFGYDVDSRHLVRLVERKEFTPPGVFGMAFAWQVEDIQRLLLLLDRQRRWLVGCHVNRKTDEEIQRDNALAAEALQRIDYYRTLSEAELQQKLIETADPELADKLRIAIAQKRHEATA